MAKSGLLLTIGVLGNRRMFVEWVLPGLGLLGPQFQIPLGSQLEVQVAVSNVASQVTGSLIELNPQYERGCSLIMKGW